MLYQFLLLIIQPLKPANLVGFKGCMNCDLILKISINHKAYYGLNNYTKNYFSASSAIFIIPSKDFATAINLPV